ncbi:dTDP-4-dehydrorhamnose reductase [Hoeflea marina]|uniref:dTDP-4-dehydrorhamnose reductase n=1 Tax=Hoeflea marina TaxID=274592 RepID=A0A317PK22_9HYPH|nr:dTDP-4-dehydrorhamnose reductase [Hoeflea marina]PWW00236.1 dTDP-4-dehydrorhamnose reductase [Hoeflea marina]
MRIAVTGTSGQLALSLGERAAAVAGVSVIRLGRPELDLLRPETVAPALAACGADIVVNAAAYTAVDRAESEPALAHAVNATGAQAVAAAAAGLGLPVIQISTDYVFDGTAPDPYAETAPTGPVSVYGASKLAGEGLVAAANPRHLIVRTAWVYSPFGGNFVSTMLRLAATRDTIQVVDDQLGNPTSALDLADGLVAAARRALYPGFSAWGIYHMAGSGAASWAGFAAQVLDESRRSGGPYATIEPIPGAQFVTAARRPTNSRLDTARAASVFGSGLPDWRLSVAAVVRRLAADSRAAAAEAAPGRI